MIITACINMPLREESPHLQNFFGKDLAKQVQNKNNFYQITITLL